MTSGWKYVLKQIGIILTVLVVALLVFALGLVIGYGMIGGEKDMWSILSPNTWQEIIGKFMGK